MDLIQIKDLSFSYPAKKDTLKHVDLKVQKGTFTCIVGENGSGKSHTLKILTEIFLAVQNENTRNSLTYTYYRLAYILQGKRITIEIAQNKVGIHVGKQLFDFFQESLYIEDL